MILKTAGDQPGAHHALTARPGVLRVASFLGAAAALALSAALLVTMKISWTDHRADDPPTVGAIYFNPPIVDPPRQSVHQPPATQDPQGPTIESSEPDAQPHTQTVTNDTSVPVSHDIAAPRWLETPNARDFERFYPPRALARGVGGRVLLDCVVGADGRIACAIASETPQAQGFGEAALRIAQSFRMSAQTIDGQPTDGGHVRVPIQFRAN